MQLEVLRWLADRGMGAVLWAGFGLCVGVPLVFDLGLIPSGGDVATASSFAVNVALLAKPLGDIGKVYTKWRKVTPEAGTSGIAAERAERSRWRRPRKARRHDRLR